MRAQEAKLFSNFSSSPQGPFRLEGGRYVVCMVGTSGTLSLEILGPDGSTYIICKDIAGVAVTNAALGTASFNTVDLPPGQYEFIGASPVGAYAEVVRCPGD